MPRNRGCRICGDTTAVQSAFCSACRHDQLSADLWYATAPLYERGGRIPQVVPAVLKPMRRRRAA